MSKILEINTVADCTNAVGRLMMSLVAELRAQGHGCYVATGRGDFTYVDYRIGNKLGVYNHYLWSRINDSQGMHSRSATRGLVKYFKDVNPDVVHLHNLHGHYLNIELLLNTLAQWGGRVVMTMHDLWWLTGHCTQFDHNGCLPWEENCRDCSHNDDEYPLSLVSQAERNLNNKRELLNSIRNQLVIVVPTRWMQRSLEQSYLQGVDCRVIPNGVDTKIFHLPQAGAERSGLLCVAARWSKSKMLDKIVKLSGETDMAITVVGDLMGNKIDTRRIKHIRHLSPSELAVLYQRSAVLVNPTQVESYGMVTVEGLSCGVPVVVNSHCGASVELMRNGGGVIADPDDLSLGVEKILMGDFEPLLTPPPSLDDMCTAYLEVLGC
ncbi:MAG: glycosyltransferase [Muribaculaceae bacterium]|nr:glycosyltransferase [Muribaculaceae bacterium]MDE6320970.1 glycosyltransferase [Muribaculaceae bacterium]